LGGVYRIGNEFTQENVVIAVEKLFNDRKNVLSLNPYLSFLHMLCFICSGQNECQNPKVTGWHSGE
jgi:hypothetical protein